MEDSSVKKWWVALGYPAFDVGEDGFPLPGQVIRYFRQTTFKDGRSPWTQKDLAIALKITEGSVINMENRNIGLNNYERRRFLCELLKIPPILLGLATTPDLASAQDQVRPLLQNPEKQGMQNRTDTYQALNLRSTREQLAHLWMRNQNSTAFAALAQLDITISHLYTFLPFSKQEKPQVLDLLCRYHILTGNILRDQQQIPLALSHLNRAVALAKSIRNETLHADALFRRTGVYRDGPFSDEEIHLEKTLFDARIAESGLSHLSAKLAAVVLIRVGSVEAKAAQDSSDRQIALQKIDKAAKLLQGTSDDDEDGHFLNISLNKYHVDKAWALNGIGWYQEALTELSLVERRPNFKRRTAFSDILMAKAYLGLGNYPMAVACLEAAFETVIEIHSHVNYKRIISLTEELAKSPFGRNPEVARLTYQLRKAQV